MTERRDEVEQHRDDGAQAYNLSQLIVMLEHMGRVSSRVSVEDILNTVGRRSFGPMLLVAGLITLAPLIGDIPGMPTLMAAVVLLTAVQLLVGRKQFWLPQWLLRRHIARTKFDRSLPYLKKPARWIDRWLRIRLPWLTDFWGNRLTALTALIVALAMPPMEFIPFSANGAGLALSLLGLGLVARDGLAVLLGIGITAATIIVVAANLL
ncbi:exopolysaccharide biosynthesis protein [Halomonas vilamensis]|uniref:Exopolysaccharide biosynthesis protein n=1 Tax=Vreelandella vilamensis TaxID=531309 RepID=A0ABU1H483_9GAMM|nr:exopolysaccharide biosynthesis protein [Halomonas vilamensis]MDR5898641.1 exopolysaccharide biosynthesis protein [Halomonas vilamensis]